jgi:preprotein translocase subunit SecA
MDRMGAQEGEVLTHPLITRSIETAQKRVELQNFQQRKRLLEYDDVMNQQRDVIYSLRTFALEGAEELKGEAQKMVEKAITRRIEMAMVDVDDFAGFDFNLLGQELLQRYLLLVPEFEEGAESPPASTAETVAVGVEAGRRAFAAKFDSLNSSAASEGGALTDVAGRVLAHVMLGVLDEKWKDHLYDLDQLRNSIGYRAWGQKDPLVEYKEEAYKMFVDLMHDIYSTLTERFLRAQIVFGGFTPGSGDAASGPGARAVRPAAGSPAASPNGAGVQAKPARRFNALGILEDVPEEEAPSQATTAEAEDAGDGSEGARVPGPGRPAPQREPRLARADGRSQPLRPTSPAPANVDWSSVGRNDPCPCGSGKKFKKCHGS